MKKFILLYITALPLISLAQSGVMLPNSIDLPKVTSLATCTNPEKGRMVFNTTDNKAYYCNGTTWQEMTGGGFSIPYSATQNSNSSLLRIVNEGNGRAISGESMGTSLAIGVQAITGNTNPDFPTYALFAQNYSTNEKGAGVYARHDGTGIGVWGASVGGAGVKGEAFPVGLGGTGNGVGVWAESTSGSALYAKSTSGTGANAISTSGYGVRGRSESNVGVRGESLENYGVHGLSTSGYGVLGSSQQQVGVLGQSNGSHGVYGNANNTTGYGVFGIGTNGRAGYFAGNVIVSNELLVSTNKGLLQNTSSTQLKYDDGKVVFGDTLDAFSTSISPVIYLSTYPSNPVVYIANVENTTGAYYKVIVSVVGVTTNSFRLRFYNASNATIEFTGTWNFVVIGPK
ncbi:hypothetical protein [Emticicia agri]|uniref:Uncharacterized protein n=1 Tax=Emticicia agri TaxID=2492393 RepID=A0A4Q5LXU4_9BACT|nr:hypothetical protein [Emticicia agri]RYU94455.1 hypothetical protein EWM59_16785 [Emticicia agri]